MNLQILTYFHPAAAFTESTSKGMCLLSHHSLRFASSQTAALDPTTGERSQPPVDQSERSPAEATGNTRVR
ncbi:hypothetical protein EYF80_020046 [Liparis tanakae]|uniref:Uncharacterized protein n=1 Tax=Liparis tanakae TaxID=230148 RepID=A0A4Z2HXM7_9TELE|nr:hypothetical protein EYF80_020046 [Liparis tanakae]